jgi:[ribosomal protein S5]-alanine N-acetyltransferase
VKNAFLIGAKVYLRPLEKEDAPRIVPWFNDQEVIRTMLRYRPLTLREEEEYIEALSRSEDNITLGIVVRENDRLIGATGLHKTDFRNRSTSFGILIGEKDEWGKGYGTEATRLVVGYAFDTLNMNRVWLHVYEYNARGMRSYERVGFKKEGVLRQDTFRDGRYWDTVVMAVLRDEWAAQPRSAE